MVFHLRAKTWRETHVLRVCPDFAPDTLTSDETPAPNPKEAAATTSTHRRIAVGNPASPSEAIECSTPSALIAATSAA